VAASPSPRPSPKGEGEPFGSAKKYYAGGLSSAVEKWLISLGLPCEWQNPKGIPQQSPGLRACEPPWEIGAGGPSTPPGLCLSPRPGVATPAGLATSGRTFPRVARKLTTLGWRTQSLWDWPEARAGLAGNDKSWRVGPGEGDRGVRTELITT